MKTAHQNPASRAFTLIELLVVISIIAILAGLLLPVGQSIMQKGNRQRAQTELHKVAFAIEAYKIKLGHYPPGPVLLNQPYYMTPLYYELSGCTRLSFKPGFVGPVFESLDRSVFVTTNQLWLAFGAAGIVNATASADSDDSAAAQAFLRDLKPTQYMDVSGVRLLGVLLEGPIQFQSPAGGPISPISYNPSNPTHNVNSFDLWVDVIIGNKTNRVNNWSDQPEIVH